MVGQCLSLSLSFGSVLEMIQGLSFVVVILLVSWVSAQVWLFELIQVNGLILALGKRIFTGISFCLYGMRFSEHAIR